MSVLPNIGHRDIPWHEFKPKKYYLHWYDTTNSQEKLQYQKRSIDDYVKEQRKRIPFLYRILAPILKKKVIKETFILE